jgi:hypothetical protein
MAAMQDQSKELDISAVSVQTSTSARNVKLKKAMLIPCLKLEKPIMLQLSLSVLTLERSNKKLLR